MSWARATLRRGTSSGSVWQVDANYPQARVAVGSASNAGWVVSGPGIANFHVELYWDGNALYVADTQGVGDVRLNGQPVRQWTQVQGRGQLVFGHAILELETAVAEATAMVRDPGTAPRISLVDERTRVAQPGQQLGHGMSSPPTAELELESEATRVASSLDEIPPSKAQISMRPPAPPGRGPSVPPPPPNRPPQTTQPTGAPAMGAERPRLGGAPPSSGRKEAKTLVGDELPPIGQEATRMVDTDALAPSGGGGFGAQSPQGFGQQPQAFGGPQQGFGGPQQGFQGGQQPQPFGQQPQAYGQPQGASGVQIDGSLAQPQPPQQPQQPMMGGAPMGGAPMGGAPMGGAPPGTGGFVPPPSFASTQKLDAQQDGAVPRRTRLLIMLFAAVVIAWLMMPTPEEEEAAERAAHPTPVTNVVPPGADGGVDAGPRPYVNPSAFVPVLTTEALDGGLSRTPDSVAAQLVTAGQLEDALAQYEALQRAHPERPEYGVMVEVLRRRLMTRCTNGQLWNGTPCVQR